MALAGVRVIEIAGLAPAPFCGMILADFGAKVIRVDKVKQLVSLDRLARGKLSISIDLRQKRGVDVVRRLCKTSDVLIEPFRAGVMEKLGLGPEILMRENPRLIYSRLTGYSQTGPMAKRAGHDINYIATSGVLSRFGRKGEKPHAPVNIVGDFGGGGLTCAMGIMMALYERTHSGLGQVVDANMVEGSAYLSSFLWRTRDIPSLWGEERGGNKLDGGAHYYDTYETSDGKYMSVGALEPQFYDDFIKGLGLDPDEHPQFGEDDLTPALTKVFLTKTRDEWTEIFRRLDGCVEPVLEMDEAPQDEHNVVNRAFLKNPTDGSYEPGPAPRLSRTPGVQVISPEPNLGQHSRDILRDIGYSEQEVKGLVDSGIVGEEMVSAKL